MRAVADLFWMQCKMPIFIYGMYEDSQGKIHACVYVLHMFDFVMAVAYSAI